MHDLITCESKIQVDVSLGVSEFWPMTHDTCSSNRKVYFSWEAWQVGFIGGIIVFHFSGCPTTDSSAADAHHHESHHCFPRLAGWRLVSTTEARGLWDQSNQSNPISFRRTDYRCGYRVCYQGKISLKRCHFLMQDNQLWKHKSWLLKLNILIYPILKKKTDSSLVIKELLTIFHLRSHTVETHLQI